MLSVEQAKDKAAALVEAAVAAGADAADVLYAGNASTEVQFRLGELEDVARSEGSEIGLRLFVGRRSASVSSSDLSAGALAALVERAVAMAREAPEDPYAGLAPEERLFRGDAPPLDSDDGGDPAPALLKDRALEMEAAARSIRGVTNSEGAGMSAGRSVIALATSHGFVGAYSSTSYSAGVSVIAGVGDEMQREHASHQVRHLEDLDPPDRLGQLAGERAVRRLGRGRLVGGSMPVIFDPRVGNSLIGHLIAAMSGPAIARRTSFLLGLEDQEIFAPGTMIADDPHRPRGLRSRAFDGEGLATRPSRLVEDGRLTGWLLDSASARQLGLQPTGHSTRGLGGSPGAGPTNVHLAPGGKSPGELIGEVDHGLYVTGLIGQGINPVTGDYSRGASGFVIDRGELAAPVEEITIAGNLLAMFRQIAPANDLDHRRVLNVPTVRIDGMVVASA